MTENSSLEEPGESYRQNIVNRDDHGDHGKNTWETLNFMQRGKFSIWSDQHFFRGRLGWVLGKTYRDINHHVKPTEIFMLQLLC